MLKQIEHSWLEKGVTHQLEQKVEYAWLKVVRVDDQKAINHFLFLYEQYEKLTSDRPLVPSWVDILTARVRQSSPQDLYLLAYDKSTQELAGFLIAIQEVDVSQSIINLYQSIVNCVTIKKLYVLPQFQRNGIGTSLALFAIQWADDSGYPCVHIDIPFHFEDEGQCFAAFTGFGPRDQKWTLRSEVDA